MSTLRQHLVPLIVMPCELYFWHKDLHLKKVDLCELTQTQQVTYVLMVTCQNGSRYSFMTCLSRVHHGVCSFPFSYGRYSPTVHRGMNGSIVASETFTDLDYADDAALLAQLPFLFLAIMQD